MKAHQLPDGSCLRYHDLAGSARPLLLLHGLGCASSCDYPTLARSSALANRRVLLVDLLGFGFSDRPAGFSYSVDAHAETVLHLINALALNEFDLYGHSMGGAVAIVVAGGARNLRRLVLSEPNLDPGGGQFSRAIARQDEREYVKSGHMREVELAAGGENSIWAGSMRIASALGVHRSAKSLVRGCAPSWREQLLSLSVPRTVIFGELSLPDPDHSALPRQGVAVSLVPRAGHSMAWENPEGLASAIARACA